MIYIFLNVVVSILLVFFTFMLDNKIKARNIGVNSISVALLLTAIESGIFLLILLLRNTLFATLITYVMRLVFFIDGIAFVMLSFSLVEISSKRIHPSVKFIKIALYLVSFYITFFQFSTIDVSLDNGIIIGSEYLFSGAAKKFFPWTWVTVFTTLYRYIIPIICVIFLMLLQEQNGNQLDKYQAVIIGESFVVLWTISFAITFISTVLPAFTLLYLFSYTFMYVVIFFALSKTSVPSGRLLFLAVFKMIIAYIIPSLVIGFLCAYFQQQGTVFNVKFLIGFVIYSTLGILFSIKMNTVLASSEKINTAEYEVALEKSLATIDYKNAEMDQITVKMYDILKRNIEASSMNVYILSNQNELEIAYSSNKMTNKISVTKNPIFDTLLNINKSVVIFSEIDKEHDLSVIQDELKEFFETTKSDALFVLNEGHNIFGIITLGKRVSGDHYKSYDYNVFVKLYSYFFVFGYYMRNISNKEVISVVNREIRMASQIITSIQENLDHVKNPKVDIGYKMVPAHSIGGEFIDLIRLTDTRHLFVVGDLSGKGIAASMNMVILKSIIRNYLAEIHDFKELVVKINVFVRDSLKKGTIFSGLFALIDFETDTMYYINCGIPALMMYTLVYNNVIEIQGSGHVLGFVKDISPYISVKTTKLNRGDIIFACTDGMVQSHSLRGEQFGKERIQQALLDNSTYPAQRMAQFTFDGLLKFMSKEMEDDVSILVIKYEGLPDSEKEEKQEEVENSVKNENSSELENSVQKENLEVNSNSLETENVTEENSIQEQTNSVENSQIEPQVQTPPQPDFELPEGFEMPDLSDLDDLMKDIEL